jgi:ABC-type molybdate transport system ATPase subunit
LTTKFRLLTEVGRLAGERRFQVILVSHDPGEALALCEAAILLDQGVVQATGNLRELLSSAACEPCPSFRQLRDHDGVLKDESVRSQELG